MLCPSSVWMVWCLGVGREESKQVLRAGGEGVEASAAGETGNGE